MMTRAETMPRPFHDSTDLMRDGSALAARMRIDGYLFLRGLLPEAPVRKLQRQAGEIARSAGWLRRDRDVTAAIADPDGFCIDPDPAYLTTLRAINRLEDYHRLKHHPALISLFERMLGGPILPHPRVLNGALPAFSRITHSVLSASTDSAGLISTNRIAIARAAYTPNAPLQSPRIHR